MIEWIKNLIIYNVNNNRARQELTGRSCVKSLCRGLVGYHVKIEYRKTNGNTTITGTDIAAMDSLVKEAKSIIFTPAKEEELELAA